MARLLRSLAALELVFLLARCSGGESSISPPAGTPTTLAFTMQPSSATAGAVISPAIRVAVQDAQGRTVIGSMATITLDITRGAGTREANLRGLSTVDAANGVATFSTLRIDSAGMSYTLTATALELASGTSSAFDIAAGPATKLGFTTQPSITFVGAPSTFRVAVQDSVGNTVSSASGTVTMAIGTNPGNGTLSGPTSVTTTGGMATFSGLRIDKPGTGYALTASMAGLTRGTSAPFSVTVFTVLSARENHSCGVTADGAAYCWGLGDDGQLGNGSRNRSSKPVAVSGGHRFATVSAGVFHACGVTTDGVAYCWGSNFTGQLGNGSTTDSTVPVAVSSGLTFSSVSAGLWHTCGLTTGGAAYCWGSNSYGALGNGTTTWSSTPVRVSGALTFSTASAGASYSCAVTTSLAAYCWGFNAAGQLGNGTTTDSSVPVAVSGGFTFASVSAGINHTCAWTSSGAAYCWAIGDQGQLGNGSYGRSTTPVPVSGGLAFAVVTAGGYEHSCGSTTDAAAYCWGSNDHGQLGLGNGITDTNAPYYAVSGGLSFSTVSAGGEHTCGLTTGGVAYCWGSNFAGQLGNGSTTISGTPVPVSGP